MIFHELLDIHYYLLRMCLQPHSSCKCLSRRFGRNPIGDLLYRVPFECFIDSCSFILRYYVSLHVFYLDNLKRRIREGIVHHTVFNFNVFFKKSPRARPSGERPFLPKVYQSAGGGHLPRAHAAEATDCHDWL